MGLGRDTNLEDSWGGAAVQLAGSPWPGAALEGSLAEAWTGGQVQMALDLAKLCPGSRGEEPLPWLGLCGRLRQASVPLWDQVDVWWAVPWAAPVYPVYSNSRSFLPALGLSR